MHNIAKFRYVASLYLNSPSFMYCKFYLRGNSSFLREKLNQTALSYTWLVLVRFLKSKI